MLTDTFLTKRMRYRTVAIDQIKMQRAAEESKKLGVVNEELGGYIVTLLIFLIARMSKESFEVLSKYLRGSGMLLLFFASIRLCYFGESTLLEPTSIVAKAILLAAVIINMILAWRRNSPALWMLSIITGCGAALAVGTPWFLAAILTALAASSVYVQIIKDWRKISPSVFFLVTISYFIWAIGNPLTA